MFAIAHDYLFLFSTYYTSEFKEFNAIAAKSKSITGPSLVHFVPKVSFIPDLRITFSLIIPRHMRAMVVIQPVIPIL